MHSTSYPRWTGDGLPASLLLAYFRGPDHPAKLRIGRALTHAVFPDGIPLIADTGGRALLDPADFVGWAAIREGAYEPRTLALLRSLLSEGGAYVDVGANVGHHLGYVSGLPRVECYAIEAHPDTFRRLKKTAHANGLSASTLLNVAVSDTPGELVMESVHQHNTGANRVRVEGTHDGLGGGKSVRVTACTLESILQKAGVQPTVIKIDVEGYEMPVLRGMDWDGPHRPHHIVIEFSDYTARVSGEGRAELAGFLEKRGYRGYDVEGAPLSDTNEMLEDNAWFVDERVPA